MKPNSENAVAQAVKKPLVADEGAGRTAGFYVLFVLAIISALIYIKIVGINETFEYNGDGPQRPILEVLQLFGGAFLIYAASIAIGKRTKQTRELTWLIVGSAIMFRGIFLFTNPIQEIDIYRYIWDGVACSQAVSPFDYPPDQVKFSYEEWTYDPSVENPGWIPNNDERLKRLIRTKANDQGIYNSLHRIHFSNLPTVYPPTSQVVFTLAALTTPHRINVMDRLIIMKAWLVLFDIGVIFLVLKLLDLGGLPRGLSIGYAWCPLVLKEVANSGHLDAIAVFFSVLAIYLFVRALRSAEIDKVKFTWYSPRLSLVALVIAIAVGAKLYPIVLAPVVLVVTAVRFGTRCIFVPAIVFCGATALLAYPMLPSGDDPDAKNVANLQSGVNTQNPANQQAKLADQKILKNDPSLGMQKFLKEWEMNDFAFMIVYENLKTKQHFPSNKNVWFSYLPDSVRVWFVDTGMKIFGERLEFERSEIPFMMTRLLTGIVFLGLAFYFAVSSALKGTIASVCEACFLTIAWFWFLCPTQNPWYWMWAMPFLPFVRNRAWIAVSGLAMVYYLRFWLDYHRGEPFWELGEGPILEAIGSWIEGVARKYPGTGMFDFVVTWIEFGPWMHWLFISWLLRLNRERGEKKLLDAGRSGDAIV